MQVANLFINGSKVITKDEPILGEEIKLSLERDFTYSCIDTKMDIEVKFYCASGKAEIDLAYEENGIEAFGEIEIVDDCGTLSQFFKFRLDFKSYKSNSEFTTLGITDMNSDWKSTLTNEVNVADYSGAIEDFYVRRLQLEYDYSSQNVYGNIEEDTINTEHSELNTVDYNSTPPVSPPLPAPTLPPSFITGVFHEFIMPRVDQTRNELEDSDGLVMDYLVISNYTTKIGEKNDISNATTAGQTIIYSEIEPTPVFTNANVSGEFNYASNNTSLIIDLLNNTTIDARCELIQINEIISIGQKYDNPRLVVQNELDISSNIFSTTIPFTSTITFSKVFNRTFEVKDDESVWIYYHLKYKDINDGALFIPSSGLWRYFLVNILHFKSLKYQITNTINANFKITNGTAITISSVADIEPYHSKTKAYNGDTFITSIFATDYNLCQTPCFSDLWFSRGDYLRNKVNVSDFIVKPSDFFIELEKVICCGLGYFYFNNGSPAEKRLMTVYDFYSDIPVPSQYIFNYSDIIDAEIKIEPFLSPYYKEIQIGYSNSKDTPIDVCKQNAYTIPNRSDSIYSKVSDFIASMFIISKALRLGTDDKDLEYDKNIFILSGTTISASPANYNVTLSQSSGFLADNVQLNPTNTNGINRRYATVFNLFRHLYKWGFSLFSNKDTLRVSKYEGSSIYDLEILDTSVSSVNPYYPGLSDCKLPNLNLEKVDRTVDNMYSIIQSNMYVPSSITFRTSKLSTFDLIALRAFQYDLFQVSDGVNTYYGNLISANLVDDVTEIKLLRRFKNGI